MLKNNEKHLNTHPELKIPFEDWLLHGQGVFHISGKPGSGKSTLMKMLCSHRRTASALRKWAGEKKLVFTVKDFRQPDRAADMPAAVGQGRQRRD